MKNEDRFLLVVDDDASYRALLERLSPRLGLATVCTDSMEAFAKVLKNRNPSACLVDLMLGDTPLGFTIIQGIRKKFGRSFPIVVLSSISDEASVCKAIELGADDYLHKPILPSQFYKKMELLLEKKEGPWREAQVDAPPGGYESALAFSMQVKSISEEGIQVLLPHRVRKGTPLRISGAFLQEVFSVPQPLLATVRECQRESEREFLAHLEFFELSQDALASIRKFLLTRRG